ncbi:TKL protein kinase [Phytophthora palmivora]|uniref:TKL protein kinase n=1 Tax=Phytophthora palmivora TaxID=4796 RepID=A0A2P4WXP0_9STRA|nr:TKL protein kinase [Phytophthora palmivora]
MERLPLKAYEQETRVLLKLSSTGHGVNILQRFGRVVESYIKVMKIEMTEEVRQWRDQLDIERQDIGFACFSAVATVVGLSVSSGA